MSKRRGKIDEEVLENRILITLIVIAVIIITAIGYAWISSSEKSKTEIDQQIAESEQTNNINENLEESEQADRMDKILAENENVNEESESASSSIGKSVDESTSELQEVDNITKTENTKAAETSKEDNQNSSSISENTQSANTSKVETSEENKKEEKQEEEVQLSFIMPVDGEIIKAYSKENLVFSETLQEWVTHQALDIKANSRDVVKCAEEGTVKSIKNDPRYGLTVIVEHSAGFQTVYSNLLTAEYVVEGEEVKQGQTLGTVGSSAVFEIADESHLHFEMLLNSEYVDPSLYIK